ncbi:MAG: N-acetylglucosamine-6-phosphate deacetylase [Cytophagales bacterium]|nr:N-acetylglucosamine-6-phosphate deacetylase [Cytophagales bacterium]
MTFTQLISGDALKVVEGIHYLDGSPVAIAIRDGEISRITRKDQLNDPLWSSTYVAPGFIDHQVNGYLSHSFTGEHLSIQQVQKITRVFWEHGITTYLPTLTSHSYELLQKNFTILREAMQVKEIKMSVPGFHLEGPYISPVAGYRGAHEEKWIRNPDWKEFLNWYRASGNKIREVTLAPELEGAIDFIKKCRERNIVVALGHHNGSAAMIRQATDAGASVSTHLGNGCANLIHRHDNPLWPQLADDRLTASLIVDGFHLRPEEVRVFYKVKGPERTILVSDVSSLAGMPPGVYESYGREVVMTPEGKISMPSQDVLAAASFLITKGIENIISFTQCSLPDAIHMATRNPARLLGLHDRGELSPGKRADLVWFEMKNGELLVRKTMVQGKVVFNSY